MKNYKYIDIISTGLSLSGKTKTWRVENKNSGDWLGGISWHGAWRQYVYYPNGQTLYSSGCMEDISDFIKHEMQLRREKQDPQCSGSGYAHKPHGKCTGYTYDRT